MGKIAVIIGENIRRFRDAQGLSQRELAAKIEVDPGHPAVNRVTVSGLETGDGGLSEKMIARVCTALGVDQEALIETPPKEQLPNPTLTDLMVELRALRKESRELKALVRQPKRPELMQPFSEAVTLLSNMEEHELRSALNQMAPIGKGREPDDPIQGRLPPELLPFRDIIDRLTSLDQDQLEIIRNVARISRNRHRSPLKRSRNQ